MSINKLNVTIKGSGKGNKPIPPPPSDTPSVIFGANVSKPHVNQPKPKDKSVDNPGHTNGTESKSPIDLEAALHEEQEGVSFPNALAEIAPDEVEDEHSEEPVVEQDEEDHTEESHPASDHVNEPPHPRLQVDPSRIIPDVSAVSTHTPDISIVDHSG